MSRFCSFFFSCQRCTPPRARFAHLQSSQFLTIPTLQRQLTTLMNLLHVSPLSLAASGFSPPHHPRLASASSNALPFRSRSSIDSPPASLPPLLLAIAFPRLFCAARPLRSDSSSTGSLPPLRPVFSSASCHLVLW